MKITVLFGGDLRYEGRAQPALDHLGQLLLRLAVAQASLVISPGHGLHLVRLSQQLVHREHVAALGVLGSLQRRAVGLDTHDCLLDGLGGAEDVHGVAVTFAHLLAVDARDGEGLVETGFGTDEHLAVGGVEVAGRIPWLLTISTEIDICRIH